MSAEEQNSHRSARYRCDDRSVFQVAAFVDAHGARPPCRVWNETADIEATQGNRSQNGEETDGHSPYCLSKLKCTSRHSSTRNGFRVSSSTWRCRMKRARGISTPISSSHCSPSPMRAKQSISPPTMFPSCLRSKKPDFFKPRFPHSHINPSSSCS